MKAKAAKASGTRVRDAEGTQKRILDAARAEFARSGLGGARVDAIAERADANKRMIYHYFGSKEDLFKAVLEDAYSHIRAAERRLELDRLEPEDAIEALVEFTWRYYLEHPEFLTLVNSENLHKARHLKQSRLIRELHVPFVEMMQSIIDRGIAKGVFRDGIDATNLSITIAALGYYYLTNRHTGSIIYGTDLMAPEMLEKRLQFNLETIRRLLRR
jgi:AcrR family transcriptional regulator